MYKRSKKDMAINIDEKKGHLFLGIFKLEAIDLNPFIL